MELSMVQVKIVKDEKSLSEIFSIWEVVFGRNKSDFVYNDSNIYIILYEGLKEDNPIGAAMIKAEQDNCLIENLAVVEKKRNQQNGEFLLRFTVDTGFQSGYEKVYVFTKVNKSSLLEKVGFSKSDDKIFPNMTKYQINQEKFYKKCKH